MSGKVSYSIVFLRKEIESRWIIGSCAEGHARDLFAMAMEYDSISKPYRLIRTTQPEPIIEVIAENKEMKG